MNSMEQRIQSSNREELGCVISFYQDVLDAHVARLEETNPRALLFERDLRVAISHYDELDTLYLVRAASIHDLVEAAQVVRVRFGIWASMCL